MTKRSKSQPIPFRSKKIQKTSSSSNEQLTKPQIPTSENPTDPTQNPLNPIKSLTSPLSISIAIDHLLHSDPILTNLINSQKPPNFISNDNNNKPPFQALTRSILFQQLATKAAESIYNRFTALCGGESTVGPAAVLALSAEQLRAIGVSGRKASYLHDLATKYEDGVLSDSSILEMDDERLITELTKVRGIGVWTVHMFMMFSLQRADVLPVGDLGVRKGVKKLYGLKELPTAVAMEKLCEKWKPFRSVGSWYMWRLMDDKVGAAAPEKGSGDVVNGVAGL